MLDPSKLKAVLFDLDGTLRHSVPNGHHVFWEYSASLGAPSSPESRRAALKWGHSYWAESEDLTRDIQVYGQENAEFWINYTHRHLQALGVTQEQADEWAPKVNQHMRKKYNPEDLIPDDVRPTLTFLREQGYTLGLVTNRSRPVHDYMKENDLANYFDFYFAAGEIGVWKPSPEIFYYALGLARAKPEEAVYVGDNYFADVIGAQRANILPIMIDVDEIWEGEIDVQLIKSIGELQTLLV